MEEAGLNKWREIITYFLSYEIGKETKLITIMGFSSRLTYYNMYYRTPFRAEYLWKKITMPKPDVYLKHIQIF